MTPLSRALSATELALAQEQHQRLDEDQCGRAGYHPVQ